VTDDLLKTPFQPFDGMDFSDAHCFLCGQVLDDAKSREHVFPKWLLSRFNLWDQTILLLNRTRIPYRYLTIPCCSTCNNEHLSQMEQAVESAFTKGPEHFRQLDKLLLYQWTGKIFYGLFYRELSLDLDRASPELGSITTPELMEDYRTLHGFLQSRRTPIKFDNFFPGSIFVLGVETIPNVGNFDYSDNFIGMTFCIRMGNIGVITCLKDDELILEELTELYQKLQGVKLHPMQFDELCAVIFYKAYSMARSGKYVSITPSGEQSIVVKVPGFSLVPFFEDWDNEVYAHFLEQFWTKWGIAYDQIFVPPDSIRTCLSDYL
jgi:hypothetical protein